MLCQQYTLSQLLPKIETDCGFYDTMSQSSNFWVLLTFLKQCGQTHFLVNKVSCTCSFAKLHLMLLFALRHFSHFFAETFWSLKHFSNLSHTCAETSHNSVH